MNRRLYYHKTDGGAEYLCASPIEGTDEGDLFTTIARLDGDPEAYGVLADLLVMLDKPCHWCEMANNPENKSVTVCPFHPENAKGL